MTNLHVLLKFPICKSTCVNRLYISMSKGIPVTIPKGKTPSSGVYGSDVGCVGREKPVDISSSPSSITLSVSRLRLNGTEFWEYLVAKIIFKVSVKKVQRTFFRELMISIS